MAEPVEEGVGGDLTPGVLCLSLLIGSIGVSAFLIVKRSRGEGDAPSKRSAAAAGGERRRDAHRDSPAGRADPLSLGPPRLERQAERLGKEAEEQKVCGGVARESSLKPHCDSSPAFGRLRSGLLLPKYQGICVDRKPSPLAHMTTVAVLDEVYEEHTYRFSPGAFSGMRRLFKRAVSETSAAGQQIQAWARSERRSSDQASLSLSSKPFHQQISERTISSSEPPARLKSSLLNGRWVDAADLPCATQNSTVGSAADRCGSGNDVHGNILGAYGRLEVTGSLSRKEGLPTFGVPVCPMTSENLSFYGARLLERGDKLEFELPKSNPSMAITEMSTGERYVEEFIMQDECANGAGGVYLEYHDLPHFHTPQDKEAHGYLLLGKRMESDFSKIRLSAFAIPFGKGIYTGPNVIHNDAFLVGSYKVMYGATDKSSCVRLFDAATGEKVNLQVQCPM